MVLFAFMLIGTWLVSFFLMACSFLFRASDKTAFLQGGFGVVYKGTWHGRTVAVKVMHIPAGALCEVEPTESIAARDQHIPLRRQLVSRKAKQHKLPHIGLMEAVVSSTMHHPNICQVFTYVMEPLTAGRDCRPGLDGGNGGVGVELGVEAVATSWELKIIMEYCSGVSWKDIRNSGPFANVTVCSILSRKNTVMLCDCKRSNAFT